MPPAPSIDTAPQGVRSEIRAFVLSKKGGPDFIGELRGLVETDLRFATGLFEASAALSGILPERVNTLRMNAGGDEGRYSAVFKGHWVSRYAELRAYQPGNAFKVLSREMAAAGVDPIPSRSTVNVWLSRSTCSPNLLNGFGR